MAIAFDVAVDGGNNGGSTSSLTFSHTTSGSDRLLFVGVKGGTPGDGDLVTGATYNAVSMALVDKHQPGGAADRWSYLFLLKNPASGAHNVVVSASGTVFLIAGAASYTGADQTTQPDASNTGEIPTKPLTIAVTTIADLCWTVLFGGGFTDNSPPTAGSGTTRRTFDAAFGTWGLFDSAAAITPAGSTSLECTYAGTPGGMSGVIASFKPAAGGASVALMAQGVM